mmetsp:Transcript_32554/g.102227  ORF Transcript_32554/g.102227 Transcript_32554/m.102227 type:complete len:299 (-) Transcript_32554:379-1275(-)
MGHPTGPLLNETGAGSGAPRRVERPPSASKPALARRARSGQWRRGARRLVLYGGQSFESFSHATCPMAASCAPVPVKSQTMISSPSRPGLSPLTTWPSSAYTSASVIAPAASAERSSPTFDTWPTRSQTYLQLASRSTGNSCLVGWSEPDAITVLPGCSIERSSTVAEPGVCVKTTLALAQSSSADPTAVNSHPSSARISSQKDCAISASAPYAKPVKPGRTAAVARAIDFAIAPVPMKPTVLSVGLVRYLTEMPPAAPVRTSVRKRFSWITASGAPFFAFITTKMPPPGGRPSATFL